MPFPETPQLEAFMAVASVLHFGKAAESLHITQSTVSHRIGRLEACLGMSLFERGRGGVVLTPAGEAYRRRVSAVLRDLQSAESDARNAACGRFGRLVIGYSGAISTCRQVMDAVEVFSRKAPAVAVELQGRGLQDQLHAVATGEIDLGCSFLDLPVTPPGLRSRQLAPLPLSVWVREDHSLARGRVEPLDFSALRMERWITLSERAECGFGSFVQSRGGGGELAPFTVDALDAALDLVQRGLGVTVMPTSSIMPAGVCGLRLGGVPPSQLRVFWSERSSAPVLQAFLRLLPPHE